MIELNSSSSSSSSTMIVAFKKIIFAIINKYSSDINKFGYFTHPSHPPRKKFFQHDAPKSKPRPIMIKFNTKSIMRNLII